jgi:hypothetical protein
MPSNNTNKKRKKGGNTAATTTAALSSTDFQRRKQKAKVGKRAIRSVNDTEVSFQAVSLHVVGQEQPLEHPPPSKHRPKQSPQHGQFDSRSNANVTAPLQPLISSRGKTLQDLTSPLLSHHPAAQVRQSSLKGLIDILQHHATAMALLPNLSILIPSIMHSMVDDDETVRRLSVDAMAALLSTISKNKNNHYNNDALSSPSSSYLLPFAPFVLARISSSLHSLDVDTRLVGVQITHLVATSSPQLFLPTATTTRSPEQQQQQLLAPYLGLLSDTSILTSSSSTSLEKILQALVSLLRAFSSSVEYHHQQQQGTSMIDDDCDWIYTPGGRSRNAVLLWPTDRPRQSSTFLQPEQHLQPLLSLDQWSFFNGTILQQHQSAINNNNKNNQYYRKHDDDDDSAMLLRTYLLSKLFDCLIESSTTTTLTNHHPGMDATYHGTMVTTENNNNSNKSLKKRNKKKKMIPATTTIAAAAISTQDSTTMVPQRITSLLLLLRAIRHLCEYHQQKQMRKCQNSHSSSNNKMLKKFKNNNHPVFDEVKDKCMKLIMDMFPVGGEVASTTSTTVPVDNQQTNNINTAIAITFLKITSTNIINDVERLLRMEASTPTLSGVRQQQQQLGLDRIFDWVMQQIGTDSKGYGGDHENDHVDRPIIMSSYTGDMNPPWLDVTCLLVRCLRRRWDRRHVSAKATSTSTMTTKLDNLMVLLYQRLLAQQNATIIRSTAGRRIFLLVVTDGWTFSAPASRWQDDCDNNDDENHVNADDQSESFNNYCSYYSFGEKITEIGIKFVNAAPVCLQAWGIDFLYESQHVLEALLRVVRQMDHDDKSETTATSLTSMLHAPTPTRFSVHLRTISIYVTTTLSWPDGHVKETYRPNLAVPCRYLFSIGSRIRKKRIARTHKDDKSDCRVHS